MTLNGFMSQHDFRCFYMSTELEFYSQRGKKISVSQTSLNNLSTLRNYKLQCLVVPPTATHNLVKSG